MKAEVEPVNPSFQPVTIRVTFESADELRAAYELHNASLVCSKDTVMSWDVVVVEAFMKYDHHMLSALKKALGK